jgi:hypothetical protein
MLVEAESDVLASIAESADEDPNHHHTHVLQHQPNQSDRGALALVSSGADSGEAVVAVVEESADVADAIVNVSDSDAIDTFRSMSADEVRFAFVSQVRQIQVLTARLEAEQKKSRQFSVTAVRWKDKALHTRSELADMVEALKRASWKRGCGRFFSLSGGFTAALRANLGNNVGSESAMLIAGIDVSGRSVRWWEQRCAAALIASARAFHAERREACCFALFVPQH